MLFNSAAFLVFFPAVTLLYFVLPRRVRPLWLLIASYYFYMSWNPVYALLILFSTLVTWLSGLGLARASEKGAAPGVRKLMVAASFVLNLSILFWFKYANFAIDLLNGLFGIAHVSVTLPALDILLPVGISFYTFQALSYTVDVYRGKLAAERSLLSYALYVSFFPQLVAGPIERSGHLLAQLKEPKPFSYERARDGLLLMLWGYFLKLVLADRIALFVDAVYGDINGYGGWYLIVATMLFAVQIYCDFMGYSTIAVGAARILGVELMENFDAPYLSGSVAEFWRRWHISLTSWFRDYLYIPLGGSRKGRLRKYVNTMIVFLVSGLWHGADLTFVIWGGLNGAFQVIGDLLKPVKKHLADRVGLRPGRFCNRLLRGVITFLLVDFTWLFFRAADLKEAWSVLRSIALVHNPWILLDGSLLTVGMDAPNFFLMLAAIGVLLAADICRRRGVCIRERIQRQDGWFRAVFIALVIVFLLQFGVWGAAYNEASFIYFQF